MVDATFILDVVFIFIACICAGFLAYGGWLCLGNRTTAGSQETHATSRRFRDVRPPKVLFP